MLEEGGRRPREETLFINPDFAKQMGRSQSSGKELPKLDDEKLGYSDEEKTEVDDPLAPKSGEIESSNEGGDKTVMLKDVQLGTEHTRITDYRAKDATRILNRKDLGSDEDTAIVDVDKLKRNKRKAS